MARISKILVFLTISFAAAFTSFGQSKYGNTPEDSVKCLENLSVYKVYFDQNNFGSATLNAWRWVFNNCPTASKNIYIHGAKMYETFLKKENDSKRKDELLDTLLLIYDNRIINFKEEGKVLGFKGTDLLKYKPTDFAKAFDILDKSISIEKNKSKADVLSGYFQAAVFKFNKEMIDQKTAVEIYGKVMGIIDYNLTSGKESSKKYYDQAKQTVEALLINDIRPTCEVLISILQPKYDAAPKDPEVLKKIISTLERQCKESDLYTIAVEALLPIEPSAKAYESFGDLMYKKDNTSKAIESYKTAASLESDAMNKAKLFINISKLTSGSTAISYANQALANNPKAGAAYLRIAAEYAKGAQSCAEGAEQADFKRKTVYWLAVDFCEKAKAVDPDITSAANSMIAQYKAFFPGTEEIFFQGLKEGEAYSINCWFSGTTTVRTK